MNETMWQLCIEQTKAVFTGNCSDSFVICLLFVWILFVLIYCVLRGNFYNSIQKANRKTINRKNDESPSISIVIPVNDKIQDLKRNLSYFINQRYDNFEIIIVDSKPNKETQVIVDEYRVRFNNLNYTFIPATARYVNKLKLAISLGVKASNSTWVVLTEPDCKPHTNKWLLAISKEMANDKDLVIGYANYESIKKRFVRISKFKRFNLFVFYCISAMRNKPIGGDSCNLSFRRSTFFMKHPFDNNLKLLCGIGTYLVQSISNKKNVAVCTNVDGTIYQTEKSKKQIHYEELGDWVSFLQIKNSTKILLLRKFLSAVYQLFFLLISPILISLITFRQFCKIDILDLSIDGIIFLFIIVVPLYIAHVRNQNQNILEDKTSISKFVFLEMFNGLNILVRIIIAWFVKGRYVKTLMKR